MNSYAGDWEFQNVTYPITTTLYGYCESSEDLNKKVAVCDSFDTLKEGVTIRIKFINGNTSNEPSLNINGTGRKDIYIRSGVKAGDTYETSWFPGAILELLYDSNEDGYIITNFNYVKVPVLLDAVLYL